MDKIKVAIFIGETGSGRTYFVSELLRWDSELMQPRLNKIDNIENCQTDKINVLIADVATTKKLLKQPYLDIRVFRIKSDEKTRLLRQLNRTKHPDIKQIIKTYIKDEEDFLQLEFDYTTISNEDNMDLWYQAPSVLASLVKFD